MERATQRLCTWLVGATMLTASVLPGTAFAAAPIHASLDGHELSLPVAPIIENERTLIPMRGLLEALGATVAWDQPTHTVTANLNGTVITAQIDNTTATVNGQAVQLDVPPRIVDSTTLVPLRFFVEKFGFAVSWDDGTRTVLIDTHRTQTVVNRDSSTVNRNAAAMVAGAQKLVGSRYAWGGISPDTGFDCSGFVYYVAKTYGGVTLPRTSEEMYNVGIKVSKDQLQAGDLVFFATYTDGPSHVGIYDGHGGFINAENESTGVTVIPMDRAWWAARYLGARRIVR